MVEYHEPLKLGKGSAFVKSKLRNLPQTDDVWEVDFQPIPEQVCKRVNQGELWLGLVVSVPQRFHLANLLLEVPPPTVNDLARVLAHAMNRPLVDRAHRPARIHLRDNPQWRELLPHLEQLGIEVVTQDSLPAWDEMALEFFRGMREIQVEHGMGLIALPIDVERTYPSSPIGCRHTDGSRSGRNRAPGSWCGRSMRTGSCSRAPNPKAWVRRWSPWSGGSPG